MQAETRMNAFFSGRGLRGIRNRSSTCYIASAVQLIAHCPVFLHYVLAARWPASAREPADSVVNTLRRLLIDLWITSPEQRREPAEIDALVDALARSASCTLDLRRQNDAQEFLVQLIDALQQNVGGVVAAPAELQGADALDSDKVPLPVFMDRAWFDAHHKSYSHLATMLHGQLVYEVVCGDCGKRSPSSDIFSTLTVDIPAATLPEDLRAPIALGTCISRVFRTECLDGCGWRCDACKQVPASCKRVCRLWRAPQVLLCCIKRFDAGSFHGKISRDVSLPEYMDMTNVFVGPTSDASGLSQSYDTSGPGADKAKTKLEYRLMSVLCHHGSAHHGHYVAYCRDASKEDWHAFDDESVCNVAFERIDTHGAYILAYERMQ